MQTRFPETRAVVAMEDLGSGKEERAYGFVSLCLENEIVADLTAVAVGGAPEQKVSLGQTRGVRNGEFDDAVWSA